MPIKYKDYYKKYNNMDLQNIFGVSNEMVNTRLSKLYQDELFSRKLITKLRNKTLVYGDKK